MKYSGLLAALKDQLIFFDNGGYGRPYRSPWRSTLLIRDSPLCLNATPTFTRARPCNECMLFSMVPTEKKHSLIPCHHIPLNSSGDTIAKLYESSSQEQLDRVFHDWLRATIQRLEKEEEIAMKTLECTTAISFKNILFLTDLTPTSQTAFSYAVALARHFDARLYPAHVVFPFIPNEVDAPEVPNLLAKLETERQQQLVETVQKAGVAYTALVSQEAFEEVVSRWVNEHGIDLIVIGTHGRKGVERFLLGSTAEEIFRTANCPVLTLGPNVTPHPRGELAIRKVLAAVSLTKEFEPAVTYALSFAQERQARITLLHILPNDIEYDPEPTAVAGFAQKKLENLVPPEADLAKPEFVVVEGDPAKKILECARKESADLIVLGLSKQEKIITHFRRGVAYKVVSGAPCAVLTVRG
jgi:nucleotide-binding universal stress UspA family protein